MMLDEDRAVNALRSHGMRVTPQRRAVISELCGDETHPLAEEVAARVQKRVPGISLSTVYKTIAELAELGLVRRLEGAGAMRIDPDTGTHAHFTCAACGEVSDVEVDAAIELLRESVRSGAVDDVSIDLAGTCPACMGVSNRQ